jgi:predicted  nucleic acid-binding Zn-ribbon protein
MEFKIPKELEIKLKINGFNDSDIGDKIFKPKHVDEKLGDKLYFTDNYELSSTNLDKVDLKGDKVDFKNDVDKHRYILSSKSKMRDFMVKMQLGDKGEKGARYAEQSVKEAQKKFDEAKEKQSEEQLLEEQKNIEGKLQTAKQSKEGLEKEITNIKEKLEPSKEDKEKNIENVKEKREKEKEIAKLEEELEAATAGITKLDGLEKTLTAAEKTKNGLKTGPTDVKSRSEIVETNLKFILKIFFANKTNIKLSPNNFTIYSSDIGEGKLEDAKSSDKKGSKKSQLIRLTTTFNIKIFEKKDKVGVLDMAKVGCKERAERIEKDVFELLGISVDLFQNSNVYNPVNILNKLREDSSKKDTIREERIRMAKEREIERREEKAVKKEAKAQAKEERKRLAKEENNMKDIEEDEEEEESDDEDDYDIDDPREVEKFYRRDMRNKMKEDQKRRREKKKNKKGQEGKGVKKDNQPGEESGQKGGYKYRGKSPRKAKKTRRKTPKSKRKTRRKYR